MPSKRQPTEPSAPVHLTCSRDEARDRLEVRIAKGRDLLARSVRSEEALDELRADFTKWSQYNRELLLRIFDSSTEADEYSRVYGAIVIGGGSFIDHLKDKQSDIAHYITRLESIVERLELIPEPPIAKVIYTQQKPDSTNSRTVFVVHGHDEAAKEAVARFVMKLGLKPIILAEEPNAGKTVIEKLEASSGVGFAVVLLTPDDVGASKAEVDNLSPRARQNVILELGYFVARLGRERVCALHRSGVELPSDYHGVAYVEFDAGGAWKLVLAREIKAAGVDVDLNLAM